MDTDTFFAERGWDVVDVLEIDGRRAQYFPYDYLNISEQSHDYLKNAFPRGIYGHQKEAMEAFLKNENVCLTTGTASGKSMIFYFASIEELSENPSAKILAIYPLKALGKEQGSRWQQAFQRAGLLAKVGRIDGQVAVSSRLEILKNSQVLVVTPDVLHAWFMSNLSNKNVIKFLSNLSLMIIDEIHNYTGVFGSNAAFLFRRIQHIMSIMRKPCRYICASATISNPALHLEKLLGIDFRIIDRASDTSPKEVLRIKLVNPYPSKDLLTNISDLLAFVAQEAGTKFITFVDSRKQTEYVASIVSRTQQKEAEEEYLDYDHLKMMNILPFRAGYEETDRSIIQERLSEGSVSGVVSTSALELGIDIPHLNLGILLGVPHSATSFFQRIGRIGRSARAEVVVINRGDIYSENVFRKPQRLLHLPFSEVALYLENPRIQYIHALCLSRQGGEHHQICDQLNIDENENLESNINWPKGFMDMCKNERLGLVPPELQSIKEQAGDDPNHAYPLRDVDAQFRVEFKRGPERRSLGSLSYGQLMRESYPGAVYYYTARPYRIYRVRVQQREVEARREKRYTTTPINLPTLVFPNLSPGNVYSCVKFGKLVVTECSLQIREAIIGFKERRGPSELSFNYPLDRTANVYFDQPRFARNFFTSGVVLAHPIFNGSEVRTSNLAKILYEAFLMIIPFERADINYASDKYKINSNFVRVGDRFVCIYDQTYGSLRLSGRILEGEILAKTFQRIAEIAGHDLSQEMNKETLDCIEIICRDLQTPVEDVINSIGPDRIFKPDRYARVIMPGSKGLNIKRDNEEFDVEGVFFSPSFMGLAYRGKHISEQNAKHADAVISVPVGSIIGIPGESSFGLYDLETGELKPEKK
jgi:DEAD/DEAH box helicase domain-containing protein